MTPLLGTPTDAVELHLITWNIRRRMDLTWPADRWAGRAPRLGAVLSAEAPAVLCVQEAMPDQARSVLGALGPHYGFVGRGRNRGGRGEGCPIFYDSRRLEVVSHEQTALSDTPHESGTTSWGNITPRILVRADFSDRLTGRTFTVLNTHLDVFSARSRVRAAQEIHRQASEIAHPLVLTGDFNAGPDTLTLFTLLADDTLRDAWEVADRRVTPRWDTFANYGRPRVRRGPIDWILVGRGAEVRRVGVDDRVVDSAYPSDHLALHAALDLGGPLTPGR